LSPNARHDAQILLDALPLPSYIYELSTGRVLGANAQFCSLLGYSLADVHQMDAPTFYAAEELDRMWHLLRTLPSQGTGDRRFQTRDGRIFCGRVRYRNTELMNVHRDFVSARLVVLLGHEMEQAMEQAMPITETARPEMQEK
jgi:PAS domain S-box-containing protein